MDIQVSSNFERLLFEAYGRDAEFGARADERSARRGDRFASATLVRFPPPRGFIADAPTRRDRRHHPPCCGRAATCSIRTAPSALRRARADARSGNPHVALATAHPAKFPDAMQAITGERPAAARGSPA